MKKRIVVADDDAGVRSLIASALTAAGFEVVKADDATSALLLARKGSTALVVLDSTMRGLTGLEVCRALKSDLATSSIRVFLLTRRENEADRIIGFELGADDCLTKPFSPRELVLRAKNILNRQSAALPQSSILAAGDIVLDRERHEVSVSGRAVELTAIEFRLLTTLMEFCNVTLNRKTLLARVWGCDAESELRTVDTHVGRLRDKLGHAARQIRTMRGFGYRLDDDAAHRSTSAETSFASRLSASASAGPR